MPTLRLVLIVLLALNLLAFAAIRGWLGRPAPDGEPERISNQLNPDRIRLATVAAPAAPLAIAGPPPMTPRPAAPAPAPAPAPALAADVPETPVAEIATEPPAPAPQAPAAMDERHVRAAEPDIVQHREMRRQAELLCDQRQTEALRVLRRAGLVSERRHGRQRVYHLQAERLTEVRDWLAPYERFWRSRQRGLRSMLDDEVDEMA